MRFLSDLDMVFWKSVDNVLFNDCVSNVFWGVFVGVGFQNCFLFGGVLIAINLCDVWVIGKMVFEFRFSDFVALNVIDSAVFKFFFFSKNSLDFLDQQ